MKTSEIFEACIPLIESGREEFICLALYQVAHQWNHGCHKIILARLEGHGTLDCWILHNFPRLHIEQVWCNNYKLYVTMMRQTRINWLKSLVEEFKAKGD